MQEKFIKTMEAFVAVTDATKARYNISFGYSKFKESRCTVTVLSKTFTEKGEGCLEAALKAAVRWFVFTFDAFKEVRKDWIEADKKSFCKPITISEALKDLNDADKHQTIQTILRETEKQINNSSLIIS